MAFRGFDEIMGGTIEVSEYKKLATVMKLMNAQTKKWGKGIEKETKKFEKSTVGKHMKGLNKVMGFFAKAGAGVFSMSMDVIGVFIQLLDKMGVFQPLMDAVGLIFQLIGAEALPYMMDALEGLYEVILEMDWSEIGVLVGEFMVWLITEIVSILTNPGFYNMIKSFIKILGWFLKVFMKIMGAVVWFIGMLDIPAFKLAILALVNVMAFMYGFMQGGGSPYGLAMGIAFATAATIAVGALLFTMAQGGIVTKPTFAMIGEAGPEAVIPLSEGSGMLNNDEVVWAIEDNSIRLDILIGTVEEQNRLKRMKVL